MTREEAIEYWEGLRKTFSSQLEKEENHFGRMHLQTTIDALDMAISALRQQEHFRDVTKKVEPLTNAQKIRSMSDDELALWICGVYDIEEEHGKFINGIIIPGYAPHDIEEWLQQPAEEDDHDERKENENV